MELMWHCPMLDVTRPYANIFHMPAKVGECIGHTRDLLPFLCHYMAVVRNTPMPYLPQNPRAPAGAWISSAEPADLLGLVESVNVPAMIKTVCSCALK